MKYVTFIQIFIYFNCRKLRNVVTARVLKFLNEKAQKQTEEYDKFYKDYSIFLKEGIVSTDDQREKVMYIFFHFTNTIFPK